MKCLICGCSSESLFYTKILNKYDCQYYKCSHCGFIQTEKPYWLEEAYSSAITCLDIGLISRNIYMSKIVERIILNNFNLNGVFLDYAGGYGMFVRIMRDKGFDFYRQDKFCENIFASSFDLRDTCNDKFELLTAFEVFEHLYDPVEEVKIIGSLSDNILFSTSLVPANIDNLIEWRYLAPETGQHISFYTLDSLRILLSKFGYYLYSNGVDLHLATRCKMGYNPFYIPWYSIKYRVFPFVQKVYDKYFMRTHKIYLKSKIDEDFEYIRNKMHG